MEEAIKKAKDTEGIAFFTPNFAVNFGWHHGRRKYFAERIRFEDYRPHWSDLEKRYIRCQGWNSKGVEFFEFEGDLLENIKIFNPNIKT